MLDLMLSQNNKDAPKTTSLKWKRWIYFDTNFNKYPNLSRFFCQKARIKTYLSYILSNQDERTIPIAQVFEILIRMVVKCCHEKSQKKIHRHGSFSCNCHCAQISKLPLCLKTQTLFIITDTFPAHVEWLFSLH